jgi:hypothetical protein
MVLSSPLFSIPPVLIIKMKKEIKEKMDELVLTNKIIELRLNAKSLIKDFKFEGFEDEDIYEYLCNEIKEVN